MESKSLIIADGDVALVERLANYFRGRGFTVKTAYDALTVLKLVHMETPDAFVLGINMPCNNGICVCEQLSAERRFGFMPAVLLTDRPEDAATHNCHDLRAYYVAKTSGPVQDLAARIADVLDEVSSHVPELIAE